jgi:membrane-associated protease RseP (regulator of RpoE activity)
MTNEISYFSNFFISTLSIIFWFVVLLIPLVIIHEFGHFIMARLCGVKVPEFAVGLPFSRRLFYKKWKGTVWSFYPWLLGGFVRLTGDGDAVDNAHWEMAENPEKARNLYKNQRRDEILQAQELQFFLEENNLVFDNRWQWYEKTAKNGLDNPKNQLPEWQSSQKAQTVQFVPKSKMKQVGTNNSEVVENNNLKTEENQEEKMKIIEKEFMNLDDQLLTLIDWEWETKLDEKGKKSLFFAKSWWQQSLIISGGVLFNLATAVVVFWIVFVFFGSFPSPVNKAGDFYFPATINQLAESGKNTYIVQTKTESPQVILMEKDGVLDKVGVKPRDELVQIGETPLKNIQTFEEYRNLIQKYKDQSVKITWKNENGELKTADITPKTNSEGQAILGANPAYIVNTKAANWPAGVSMAFGEIGETFKLTFDWFGKVFQGDGEAAKQTSGPIGVGSIGSKVFEIAGLGGILYLIGSISVSLAIFNMLPIPALDGGRFIILSFRKLTGKRHKKTEEILINFTFLFLFGLMILVAFKDVWMIVGDSLMGFFGKSK